MALWKSHRKRSSIVPDMSAIFNFFYVIWFWGILAENLQNTSKYQRFVHFCPPAYWTNLSGKTAGIDTEISPKPVRGGPLATANIFYVIPSGSDLQIASSMWFNSWISSILVSRNIDVSTQWCPFICTTTIPIQTYTQCGLDGLRFFAGMWMFRQLLLNGRWQVFIICFAMCFYWLSRNKVVTVWTDIWWQKKGRRSFAKWLCFIVSNILKF